MWKNEEWRMKNSYIYTVERVLLFFGLEWRWASETTHRITSVILQCQNGIWWKENVYFLYPVLPPTLCCWEWHAKSDFLASNSTNKHHCCNCVMVHLQHLQQSTFAHKGFLLPDAPSTCLDGFPFFTLPLFLFSMLAALCLKSKVGYFENVHAHKFIRIKCF